MIQPIETIYGGYRFRSRLEARWAVFFERCRQHYIYEHEGYRLPSGPYLPDFFFPRHHGFVEVKPRDQFPKRNFDVDGAVIDDVFPHELSLLWELSCRLRLESQHAVVVYGDPIDVIKDDSGAIHIGKNGLARGIGFIDLFPTSLFDAADAARAARFEHGWQNR